MKCFHKPIDGKEKKHNSMPQIKQYPIGAPVLILGWNQK